MHRAKLTVKDRDGLVVHEGDWIFDVVRQKEGIVLTIYWAVQKCSVQFDRTDARDTGIGRCWVEDIVLLSDDPEERRNKMMLLMLES